MRETPLGESGGTGGGGQGPAPRPGVRGAGLRKQRFGYSALLKNTVASGGSVMEREKGRPCWGCGCAMSPPALP